MKYVLDGYCGLYCGACPNLLGAKAGAEQDTCFGCKSPAVSSGWCAICDLKACARAKGWDFCYQCADYPCPKLEAFKNSQEYPYHQEVYDYMAVIAQEGVESWLEKMKIRWACPECQQEASWWDLTCQHCGQKLNGYKKPL